MSITVPRPDTIKNIHGLVDHGRAFMSRLRLRAALATLGIAAATWAIIVLLAVSWIPAVGVAVVAVAVSITKVTARLARPTCMSCGDDLTDIPLGAHGATCPSCGSVYNPTPLDHPPHASHMAQLADAADFSDPADPTDLDSSASDQPGRS
ncbi:MAG: hypothetical protein C0513_08650 [Isosphaera sp.]|nr:hypothetical protein [Isosphaera sp.]